MENYRAVRAKMLLHTSFLENYISNREVYQGVSMVK